VDDQLAARVGRLIGVEVDHHRHHPGRSSRENGILGVAAKQKPAARGCDVDLGSISIYSPSTILHFLAILAETLCVGRGYK
jgi:hypothetical protein